MTKINLPLGINITEEIRDLTVNDINRADIQDIQQILQAFGGDSADIKQSADIRDIRQIFDQHWTVIDWAEIENMKFLYEMRKP